MLAHQVCPASDHCHFDCCSGHDTGGLGKVPGVYFKVSPDAASRHGVMLR